MKNYGYSLIKAWKVMVKSAIPVGIGFGLIISVMFMDYSLSFWYGSKLVGDHEYNSTFGRNYNTGDVITIFFSIMIGGFSLGQVAPCLTSFILGKDAGVKVFSVLDRKPKIVDNPDGKIIANLEGNIEFKNIEFIYPAKPDIKVLKGINLIIEKNKKTAIVGESGSGKSTIM